MRRAGRLGLLALAAAPAAGLRAQVTPLDAVVVTAARAPQPPSQVVFSVTAYSGDELRAAPADTADDALRAAPGFGLFRRNDSLTANPTTQGVSLRGLGPSGASRSLVLLDGAPLNDPFGGWVPWSLVPREALQRAEIVRGGGASAWGNSALGGVIQLLTEPPEAGSGRFAAYGGDFGYRGAELEASEAVAGGALQILGSDFATDGVRLVAPESRGPVDVPAASSHGSLTARWRRTFGSGLEATVTARDFEEFRDNGTPFQRNGARQHFASAALAGQSGAFAWNATAYAQAQTFAQTFSSVNAARTAETPASVQFAVPATAVGAAWSGVLRESGGAATSFGADARDVRGETRENLSFVNGAFTNQRFAGGRQTVAGLFLLREQPLAGGLAATLGGRLDDWRSADGHRRETSLVTGLRTRDDRYPTRDGTEFSPGAGLAWQASPELRLRLNGQESFRLPTLNELYRPFRQGSNNTEANPALRNEHALTAEAGADWSRGGLTLGAAVFRDWLRDAVDNVTLVTGPATSPLFGTVPAGGAGLQRLNLDRVVVQGAEFTASWRASDALSATAGYLYDDATVRRAAVAPALAGKRLAEVPRQSGSLGASWRPWRRLALTPRVRWIGAQFDDDQNLLPLASAVVADLGAELELERGWSLFVRTENLGNARVETAHAANGVFNVGTPRLAYGGVRRRW